MEDDQIILDFAEENTERPIYIPENKRNYDVLHMKPSAKPVDIDNSDKSKSNDVIDKTNLFNEFTEYMSSVDGGRLNNENTSPQYRRMVESVVEDVFSGDVSKICNRKEMRQTFLAEYCVRKKYAPLTKKKYLTAIQHFYTYLLDEEIKIGGYAADDILRMKVLLGVGHRTQNNMMTYGTSRYLLSFLCYQTSYLVYCD